MLLRGEWEMDGYRQREGQQEPMATLKGNRAGASIANQRKGLQAVYLVTSAASAEDAATHT